jgi:type I restriction enzyme S subunit
MPMAEQHEPARQHVFIVIQGKTDERAHRAESLFALAGQIEARLSAAQRRVDALTPSLLARASAGEL